jgi:hypothetical protein
VYQYKGSQVFSKIFNFNNFQVKYQRVVRWRNQSCFILKQTRTLPGRIRVAGQRIFSFFRTYCVLIEASFFVVIRRCRSLHVWLSRGLRLEIEQFCSTVRTVHTETPHSGTSAFQFTLSPWKFCLLLHRPYCPRKIKLKKKNSHIKWEDPFTTKLS